MPKGKKTAGQNSPSSYRNSKDVSSLFTEETMIGHIDVLSELSKRFITRV